MKSSVIYAGSYARLWVLTFETMVWPIIRFDMQRFKKHLDIFWPQIERKHSEEYLVIILAVKRKL